jgi:DNA-binding XRE family transcriptional regulator
MTDDPKVIARAAVAKAIRDGALERQACRACGAEPAEAHHHLGYAPEQWLDVEWLCRTHHAQAHFVARNRGHSKWSEIKRSKGAPEGRRVELDPIALADLRRHLELTQTQVARKMGVTQATISELESRGNVKLSTLRAYIRALGAEMIAEAVFPPDTRIKLAIGEAQEPAGRS